MKITLLGCGGSAGVPMVGGDDGEGVWGQCDPSEPRNIRSRSSIVIEGDDGRRLLVDTGPDLRAQLLSARISAVHGVFYTHPHSDHVAGLDELRAINRVIDAPLPIAANAETMAELQSRFAYVFQPWNGEGFYRPVVEPQIVAERQFVAMCGLGFSVLGQRHGRIRSLGLRCGDFAYSTDVDFFDDGTLDALANLDTWVVGCFQRDPHPAHAWIDLVLEWRARIRPRRMVLTHMGPDMDYRTLCDELPEGVEPGFDGMVLESH